MQVDFYHLTARPLDRVLPKIVERVLENDARLLIVTADDAQRVALDRLLWTYAADSFLPHAQAGCGDDARQPVLLAADLNDPANGARYVALADGQWRDGALAFDRAFHFFDDASIAAARTAWKALAGRAAVERRYWQQGTGGGWTQAG